MYQGIKNLVFSDIYEQKINLDKSGFLNVDNSDENKSEHKAPVENHNLVTDSDESGKSGINQMTCLMKKPPKKWCQFSEEVNKIPQNLPV